MDGRRFDGDFLVVLFHPLYHLAFGAGDPFQDEVVYVEVRECLKHVHGIELPVTEDRLDGHVLFRPRDKPTDDAVNPVRRVLVPSRTLPDRLDR